MTNQQILEKAIQKTCLICGVGLVKKHKQSYAQFERQKFCSHHCANQQLRGRRSTSGDIGSTFHKFMRRRRPGGNVCEWCSATDCKIELANMSHEYREDVDDWRYLCLSCHRKYDGHGFKAWITKRRRYGQSGRARTSN